MSIISVNAQFFLGPRLVILTGHARDLANVNVDTSVLNTVTLPNDIVSDRVIKHSSGRRFTLPGTPFSVFLIAVRYANLLGTDSDEDDGDQGFIIDDGGFVVGAATISLTLTNQPAGSTTPSSLPIMTTDPAPAMSGGDGLAVPPSGGFPDDPIAVLA